MDKKIDSFSRKERFRQAIYEMVTGLCFGALYTIFEYFYDRTFFQWSGGFVLILFAGVFFFLKGYFYGSSLLALSHNISKKREEMFTASEFRCLKCSHVIKPEDNKCPNCGWTWNL